MWLVDTARYFWKLYRLVVHCALVWDVVSDSRWHHGRMGGRG